MNKVFSDGVQEIPIDGTYYDKLEYFKSLNKCSFDELSIFQEGNESVTKIDLERKTKQIDLRDNVNIQWNFNVQIHNIEDNAKAILDKNPLYYDPLFKIWWKWDHSVLFWKLSSDVEIMDLIKQTFKTNGLSTSNNRTTILNALKDEGFSRKPEEPKDTWVQIGDMVYDIASEKSFVSNPKYFIKNRLPFKLGKSTETPFIDGLFNDWQGDKADVLNDIIAYSISPKNFLDNFFFFQGGGSDGKSVFIKILETLIGFDNCKSTSLELISDPKERFQTSFLIDKYLLVLGDGNFPVLKNTKFLKEASGSTDRISAEIKGSNKTVDFESKAAIIGSFNTLPQTNDKTDGFFRRVHLTFWNKKYSGQRDVYTELINKHSSELNNLMTKSLSRLREIYQTRIIKGKLSITQTAKIYEEKSNPLKSFFNINAKEDINGVFTIGKIYAEFKLWAEQNRINSFDFNTFKKILGEQPYLSYMRTWIYQTEDGHIYRDENIIPKDKKTSLIERSQMIVYRGMTLKSSLGSIETINVSEEHI